MNDKFVKFNYDDIDTCEMKDKCVSCVKEKIEELVNNYEDELYSSIYECESPIEQLMAINLSLIEKKFSSIISNIEILGLIQQKKIKINKKNYRVDFLLEASFKYNNKYEDLISIVIECDGYDFHQKTKEQAQRDYEKDRCLQMEGYYVLRFSGSEIYNDFAECNKKIVHFICKKYYDFVNLKEGHLNGSQENV